jgi:PHD/YefM family antitoxin component YafN of YafNO toxin-antitoxin module
MTKQKRVSEAAVTYGLPVVDLTDPLIIERDGQPVAVMLPYEDYARLRINAAANAHEREIAWQELDKILARVHARTRALTPEQIEAEITAARQEVRDAHHARRGD